MEFSALPPGFQLIAAPNAAAMEQVYRLRARAWKARSDGFPDIERWVDAQDEHSLQWCVVDRSGAVIAAARLSIHQRFDEIPDADIYPPALASLRGPIGSINRLVVCPDHGGLGLSRALDQARLAAASKAGCRFVVGATLAGAKRLRSLEELGFRALSRALPPRTGPLALADGESTVILLEFKAAPFGSVADGTPGG